MAQLKATLTAHGKKIGRPRRLIPVDADKRAENVAANGASIGGIASSFGVGTEVFKRWLEEQPSLKDAIDRGRERERHVLHSGLVKAAKQGNIVAMMFLLKSRHGYREGDQGDTANRVSITFSLPGALKPEQFTFDNAPSTQPQRLPATNLVRS